MAVVKSLCVYCGASEGVDAAHRQAAVELGTRLAESGIEVPTSPTDDAGQPVPVLVGR